MTAAVQQEQGVKPPAGTGRDGTGDWAIYKRLLKYVRPYWLLFLVSVAGFMVGNAAEAYFVNLFGNLIDTWEEGWTDSVKMIPLLMLGAALARGLGEVLGEILLSQISFSVVHKIRTELFDQLLLMPSSYFDASSQGHLVSRITYNVAQLRDTGTDALKTIIQDGGKVVVYVAYMLYLSWKLTLIFVATAPIVALVVLYASRRFRRISRRIQNSMGDVTHVASEAVSGYRVVRIFGGEHYERDRFHRSSRYNRRQNLKMVATKVTSTQFIQVFIAAALSVLIVLLFRPEIGGGLSTGQVVTFLGLAGMLTRPIRKLSEVNARLQRGLAAAEDVFGQMDQPAESDDGKRETVRVEGRLEFRHLNFAYDRGPGIVLHDINLVIEPGMTVALVGKSGSGKSTLASLIPRFYEPGSGEILLDGHPLADYRLADLRRQIALVTQQVTLFNDTLERNIAYGDLARAGQESVNNAIRRSHADSFIDELPDGLQTMVGDDGVLLSGGQRQRVAIARALLKDAPLLILDEATSALDTESERHIQSALDEVMRGRTTLVIAHRLSTIEKADLIVVMEDGRIVESGDHQSLLAKGGVYAGLYDAQFSDGAPAEPAKALAGWKRFPKPRQRLPASYSERALSPLARAWYSNARWVRLLSPLSWLFRWFVRRRRLAYLTGKKTSWRAPVPVVIVGNVTVGGTGKTPLVVWLVNWLKSAGFNPGVVSRGYGGATGSVPRLVTEDAEPDDVGDEPPLIAARTGVPVIVCKDRVAAAQHLVEQHAVDIVVADDGLQHYALARDLEIVVFDGYRGVGNGLCLPAGPLREPLSRLQGVDLVVANGALTGLADNEILMQAEPRAFVRVTGTDRLDCDAFVRMHREVHAVAGIGNPSRFSHTLRELGLEPQLHPLPDHHRYRGDEVLFDDDWPVVVTEKDATKLRRLAGVPENCWYLEIDTAMDPGAEEKLQELLRVHGIGS